MYLCDGVCVILRCLWAFFFFVYVLCVSECVSVFVCVFGGQFIPMIKRYVDHLSVVNDSDHKFLSICQHECQSTA